MPDQLRLDGTPDVERPAYRDPAPTFDAPPLFDAPTSIRGQLALSTDPAPRERTTPEEASRADR